MIQTLEDKYSAISAAGLVEHQDVIFWPHLLPRIWDVGMACICWVHCLRIPWTLSLWPTHWPRILQPLGFDFSFFKKQVTWMNVTISFIKRNSKPTTPDLSSMMQALASYFTESDYNTKTSARVIDQDQEHPNKTRRTSLESCLMISIPSSIKSLELTEMLKQIIFCSRRISSP